MIRMLVRDEEGVDVAYVSSMAGEAFLGPFSADAGVEEEFPILRLDVDAVALAAGLERDDQHGSSVLFFLTLPLRVDLVLHGKIINGGQRVLHVEPRHGAPDRVSKPVEDHPPVFAVCGFGVRVV